MTPKTKANLLVILGVALTIALAAGLMVFVREQNPAIFQADWKSLTGREEVSFSKRVSEREMARAERMTAWFSNPAELKTHPEPISAEELLTKRSQYDGKRVTIIGAVSKNASVDMLQENDWPTAAILNLQAQEDDVLVLYRGDTRLIQPGEVIRVDGRFLAEEEGVLAYSISRLDANPLQNAENTLWLFRLLLAAVLWFVLGLSLVAWRSFRAKFTPYSSIILVLLALAMPLVSAGCTVEMTTVIQEDGGAFISAALTRSREDIDFIRSIPGMEGYMSAIIADLRDRGVRVENFIKGDDETFYLQNVTYNLEELAGTEGSDAGGSWFDISRYADGEEIVFRYNGAVDTRAFYENIENMPSYALSEIQEELDSTSVIFTMIMPGEVTYTNGEVSSGNRVTWQIRNNDFNQVVAESRLPNPAAAAVEGSESTQVLKLAIGGLFITGNILVLIFLLGMRNKPKQLEAES